MNIAFEPRQDHGPSAITIKTPAGEHDRNSRFTRLPGRRISVVLSLIWLLPLWAQGGNPEAVKKRSPDEVLLVRNENSPVSMAIAADYAEKRQIRHIISIQCPDSALSTERETIPLAVYTNAIEAPIREYLAAHTKINFIVLTKGIPIRIIGSAMGSCDEHSQEPANIRGHPSVDSTLAALDYASLPQALKIDITGSGAIGCAFSNRFWNATGPFSHAQYGGYLVTRLDAYTEAQAEALTTRSLAAERGLAKGKILFDVQPIFGLGDKASQPAPITGTVILRESPWDEYNADMRKAHDLMVKRGFPDELDLGESFVGQRTNLLGYFSWGSNDARYSSEAYQTLFFAPGSLGDTAVSTSARTFLPTSGGQSLLVDLIAHGLTCGKGYVDEPLLQATASPTIVLDRYTSGHNMAESFYAASRFVGWEDVVIGDPLCDPKWGNHSAH
ncbi:MAG TPA: TIGR03790 family protein [Candidatus Acidoferrales bacterium]|nr:TIGR03790 family protein [Candidatus Acidoferrales bacterium]